MAEVEFLFDYGSPTSYLAYTQMPGLAARTGATAIYRPILLGAVFKATGNHSPAEIPAKSVWVYRDLDRYAAPIRRAACAEPVFPDQHAADDARRGRCGYAGPADPLFRRNIPRYAG